jgi:peroxiredoxin
MTAALDDPRVAAGPFAPGDAFPDLELPDHAGNPRRLADLVGGDPTFLHFFRGFWCPKEQAFMRRLVALQDEAEVAYTRLVSVSVEPPEVQAAFRAGLGARWTFLSDAERRYVDPLGLREATDTLHDPYLPVGVSLLPGDGGLVVHRSYNGYWFWGRPTAEEIRSDLRAMSATLRPDWEPPRA